jgi:hypothetical protein
MSSYGVRIGRDNANCIDLVFTKVGQHEYQLYHNEAEYLRDLLIAALPAPLPDAWQERQMVRPGEWTPWYGCPDRMLRMPRSQDVGGIPFEWRPLYTAKPPPRQLLSDSEQAWLMTNPYALRLLMDREDSQFTEAEAVAEPGICPNWPTARWTALRERGRSIMAEDLEIWSDELLRAFGFK